jgi:hypothetical protein
VGAKVIPQVGPEKNEDRSEEKLYVCWWKRLGKDNWIRGEDLGGGQNWLLVL